MILGVSSQKANVMLAPIGDLVVIVAARDRCAGDQEQHLAQRIPDLAGLPRVVDLSEMVEQQPKPVLDEKPIHHVRASSESEQP